MLYVVMAFRWGDLTDHSYIVGVWDTSDQAKAAADAHAEYRGGKYACQVHQTKLNELMNSDWNATLLYQNKGY